MRVILFTMLLLFTPLATAQEQWSVEMTWQDSWGITGPGIQAMSGGGLKLLKLNKRNKKTLTCDHLKLSPDDEAILQRAVSAIPEQIPEYSVLHIIGSCDDDPRVSLEISLGSGSREIVYPKTSRCRIDVGFPDWLLTLDKELWRVFDNIKNCAKKGR